MAAGIDVAWRLVRKAVRYEIRGKGESDTRNLIGGLEGSKSISIKQTNAHSREPLRSTTHARISLRQVL